MFSLPKFIFFSFSSINRAVVKLLQQKTFSLELFLEIPWSIVHKYFFFIDFRFVSIHKHVRSATVAYAMSKATRCLFCSPQKKESRYHRLLLSFNAVCSIGLQIFVLLLLLLVSFGVVIVYCSTTITLFQFVYTIKLNNFSI